MIELDLDRMSEASDLVVSKYEWCRNEYLAEVHSDRITSVRGAYEGQKCLRLDLTTKLTEVPR